MPDDHSFKKVLESALNVSNQTSEQSCDRGQREGSLFLLKNCLSGTTLYRIFNPLPISEFPQIGSGFTVYDFPTSYVILRAMFETYINMYYLLIDPSTEEEKEHRLDLWECHGYSEIMVMGEIFGLSEDKLQEAKKKYLQLKEKIKSSNFYSKLPEKEKQSIKDSDKWIQEKARVALATKCGFHPSIPKFLYKFLSNYSHSERYSLMQIGEVKSPEHSEGLLNNFPKPAAEMLLALTLSTFATIHVPAKDLISKDNELLEILKEWEKAKKKDFAEWGTS